MEQDYKRAVLRGLGYEIPDPADPNVFQSDGPGNAAWQRAQTLAMREDAASRRN